MRTRDVLLIAAGLLLAALLLFTFRAVKREAAPPRTLGGLALPRQASALDLSRRYDVSAEVGHPVFYHSVRIVGIAAAPAEAEAPRSGPDWLIIELADKRRVYIPLASVNIVEETRPEK